MNQSKILLFAIAFILFWNIASAEDINPKCFKNYSSFEANSDSTLKIKMPNTASDIFFVEWGNFVPYKVFQEWKPDYIPYTISSISSWDKNKTKFLQDNNPTTTFAFDDLNDKNRNIIIDFGKSLSRLDFYSNINYDYDSIVKFEISEDGKNYSEVFESSLQDFNFRYLRISFINSEEDVILKKAVIRDIIFYRSSDSIYLLKPFFAGKIDIYTDYDCSWSQMREIYAKYLNKSMRATFPIDSSTIEIEPKLNPNPLYHNDFDSDKVTNEKDNCKYKSNTEQKDSDSDGIWDECDFDNKTKNPLDSDTDKDWAGDSVDNCKYVFNPDQKDSNWDWFWDLCMDDDHDGIIWRLDNCPNVSNPSQEDVNINNIWDKCEFDKDKDGIFDSIDNCITNPNADQKDNDNDWIWDICDKCKLYDPDQADKNRNWIWDKCDQQLEYEKTHDKDKDTILDSIDNCKDIPNKWQEDLDKDGIWNLCDNCLSIQNKDQKDEDKNAVGDMCEDADKDGVEWFKDNCLTVANGDQKDSDNNWVWDVCEDADQDDIIFAKDNCPYEHNPDQIDVDNDWEWDICDKKDNRFIESNRTFFIALLALLSGAFWVGIVSMIKKINK
ncbi:MAG: cartilage oligomeric matrix protein [uncultured bacterium (gcode 4)]|uniref:Cartilage oligomeric matrix protein n=1 Tax=uncultured bacterium (gcode 4) TaxID=1234023 RepID=K2FWG0_9BACT|nr:MAG: cartilage oligomeric matrix protein [uncultured bacterium (gcode 4)]